MGAEKEQIERERRQLAIMLDSLRAFAAGEAAIGPLVNDLEGLLSELELVDDEWRGHFIEAWSDLEVPWAVALDRQEQSPTMTDPTVSDAVQQLEALIHGRLAPSPRP